MSTEELLEKREATHGDFMLNSGLAQTIKRAIRNFGGHELPPHQLEALDFMASKIGRIVCGDHNEKDHWDDCAGYATLGRRYIDTTPSDADEPLRPQKSGGVHTVECLDPEDGEA